MVVVHHVQRREQRRCGKAKSGKIVPAARASDHRGPEIPHQRALHQLPPPVARFILAGGIAHHNRRNPARMAGAQHRMVFRVGPARAGHDRRLVGGQHAGHLARQPGLRQCRFRRGRGRENIAPIVAPHGGGRPRILGRGGTRFHDRQLRTPARGLEAGIVIGADAPDQKKDTSCAHVRWPPGRSRTPRSRAWSGPGWPASPCD